MLTKVAIPGAIYLARPSVIFKVSFFSLGSFGVPWGVPWERHLFLGRIHSKTREKKCHFPEKPFGTPLEAIEFLFFCAKGVPQEHSEKRHPESDTWTRWNLQECRGSRAGQCPEYFLSAFGHLAQSAQRVPQALSSQVPKSTQEALRGLSGPGPWALL